MAAIDLPARGKAKGDVTRTTVARFVRAGDGDPRYDNPELDDNGSTVSKANLRLVRGPVVGMTLGGRNIRVGIARDLLSPTTNLFVTTRGSSALEVVWPAKGTSTLDVKPPAQVDVVLLRAVVASGTADAKRAASEAANERLLAKHIVPQRDALISDRETAAAQHLKDLGLSCDPGVKAFKALYDHLAAKPDEPRYAKAGKDMATRRAEMQSLCDALEDFGATVAIDDIAKSASILESRSKAATDADARRAGSVAATQSEAVVELRVGSATGPIVAELGVVLFPLIEVEIMPHVVALGATPIAGTVYDTIDTEFGDPTDFSKGTFTYVDVVAMVARVNVILAPVGVRCFVQESNVRRYRLHDALDPTVPVANLDKWNKLIPGFGELFFPSGSLPVGYNLDARAEPWANVLMNANADKPETEHRLNVYFVGMITCGPKSSVQAVAFNDETQTQPAATVRFAGVVRPGKTKPTPFEIDFGPDQLGVCVAVRELRRHSPRFRGWLTMGRALAHELGHMGTLPHYLGGEEGGVPVAAYEDIWAARNLMHTSALMMKAPTGALSARDVGYGRDGGIPLAGTALTLKKYDAPTYKEPAAATAPPPPTATTTGTVVETSQLTAHTVPYTPKPTQQALMLRQYLAAFALKR